MSLIIHLKRIPRLVRNLVADKCGYGFKLHYDAAILRKVLDKTNQVIWVDSLSKDRSVLNVGNYDNLYDRPQENLKSNPLDWINAIHPQDKAGVEADLHLQSTGNFDVQYRVVHRDGTIRWLRDQSFILRDDTDAPQYLAGNVSDITERVALEEQTLHDQKMKAIGALSGGICHDFNNVLAVIQGSIELALLEGLPSDVARQLELANDATKRGADLTHRLLAYSRKQPLSPTSIDPAALINDLENLLSGSLSEGIELEVISGAGLWQAHADKSELQTVLLNLAINAQQAMRGQVPGKITLEVFNTSIDDDYTRAHYEVVPGQYVCFAVTDNGAGMTQAVAAKAFDPFFTTKDVGQGSGLGLSMAYGFAKQSGGHIKIYTELEKGTTVKLYLPRSTVTKSAPVYEPIYLRTDAITGIKVIIVENDPPVRETVHAQFVSFGCHTVSVSTAAEAISIISSGETFDLQLLDVVLAHGTSGPDCAKVIERILPDIRTMFMSGYTENAIIHDGELDAGVILVQKPFTRNKLLSACLRVIA